MEKTDLNYVRNFIVEGDIRQALEELLNILKSGTGKQKQLRDDVILLRTQLNDTDRKENLNLITAAEANHDRAHLQKAILDLINELEESLRSPAVVIPASTPSAGGGTGKVLARVIPIVLAALLVVLGVVFRKQLFGPGSQPESPAQENKAPLTTIPEQPAGAAGENNQPTQPANVGDAAAGAAQQTEETTQSTGSTGQQGGGAQGGGTITQSADLYISNWRFVPDPPVQKQTTRIDFIVENKGNKSARNFSIQWWAGVNYPDAEKTWSNITLEAGERRQFSYIYAGYPSWYGSLQTKIVVDPGRQIADKDRSNNILIRNISVNRPPESAGQADLSVSGWRFTPGTPVQNQAVRIDFTVENNGNKDAENFSIEWWAGVNYPGAEKTWTNVTVAAGERKNFSFLFAGYPSWYGSIQTKIVVDPNQRIDDKDRNNNVQIRTISVNRNIPAVAGQADLSVSDWRFTPDPPVQNQATRIDFTVENKGSKAAENFSVQWWAGVNYPGAEKTWTNVTLAAGERKSFSFVYAGYPSWYGSLQTKIVVDPNQRVDDKDRNNNVQIRTISVNRNIPAVAGQADLSVSDWRFTPDPPVQNQATRIDFTVKNKGSKAAENFTIQWWAGVNAPQPAKTWTNVTLGPGEQKKFTYNYAGYPSWYGQLQTKVVVDPGRQVNDANRSNNEKVLTIRVLKPG